MRMFVTINVDKAHNIKIITDAVVEVVCLPKSKKKKRKWYVRLALFLVKAVAVLAVLAILGYALIAGVNTYQQYKKNKAFHEEVLYDPLQSLESIEESLKESDETLYDRPMKEIYGLGVDPMSFDTSGNGLSDEDALTYGADPSKFSTADDGISDMVKILEGYDPKEKIDFDEELQLSFEDFGVTLVTNDLNAKYFAFIESYDMPKVVNNFESIIQPFQVKDYEGKIQVEIPQDKMDRSITAYQFNFDTLEMKKIKKQQTDGNVFSFQLDNAYPVFFLNKASQQTIKDFGTHYFFRVSMPLIEDLLGFNHKVFVFKKTLFPSFTSHEEVFTDDEFGIAEYSYQTMNAFFAFLMDKMYFVLDFVFDHDLNKDSLFAKGGLIDYGKIRGTERDAQLRVMPWLDENLRASLEDENNETGDNEEEEDEFDRLERSDYVVADSGFNINYHAFRFQNVTTTITPGGSCAGFARLTEKNFNGEDIPEQYAASFSGIVSGVARWAADLPKELSYDIAQHVDDYAFLQTKHQYNYTMSDSLTVGLTDGDPETAYTSPLDVSAVTNPDQSLLEMIQTYYIEANNAQLKTKNTMYDTKHANIIDKVIEKIAAGQIVYMSLSGGPGGHGVNAYRVEQDEYNPDKLYMYIYDNNLPFERIKHLIDDGTQEIRMEVTKEKRKTLFNKKPAFYNHYEFDFAPLGKDNTYRWASENGDKVRFFQKGKTIKK